MCLINPLLEIYYPENSFVIAKSNTPFNVIYSSNEPATAPKKEIDADLSILRVLAVSPE